MVGSSMWTDRIIQVFFVLLITVSLGKMVFDPFGFFLDVPLEGAGFAGIHTLTVFLVSCMFLVFWGKVLKDRPFFSRFILAAAFCLVGYVVYDVFWMVGLSFNPEEIVTPFFISYLSIDLGKTILQEIVWIVIPIAILIFFRVWRRKYVPRIPVKRFVLVLMLNFLLILWLEASGFYSGFWNYVLARSMGFPGLDPHGWVWFIGKALGMLSWPFIFIDFREVKTKLQNLKRL